MGQEAKACPGLYFKFLKERVLLDDTTYLHLNLKLFNEGAEDTSIVYVNNWNFCFYPGDNNVIKEDRNGSEKGTQILFFFRAGQKTPENLILLCSKEALRWTEDFWRHNHYDPSGESGGIQGDCNQLCPTSDFRKLCGRDTFEIDFWLSDPRFANTSPPEEVVNPRIFAFGSQTNKLSLGIRNQISVLGPKDLHLVIKNPAPLMKKGYYSGHFYPCTTNSSDCEAEYQICRIKPCLR
jgi:hypothetical protein